jgi:hypothetical protein
MVAYKERAIEEASEVARCGTEGVFVDRERLFAFGEDDDDRGWGEVGKGAGRM